MSFIALLNVNSAFSYSQTALCGLLSRGRQLLEGLNISCMEVERIRLLCFLKFLYECSRTVMMILNILGHVK